MRHLWLRVLRTVGFLMLAMCVFATPAMLYGDYPVLRQMVDTLAPGNEVRCWVVAGKGSLIDQGGLDARSFGELQLAARQLLVNDELYVATESPRPIPPMPGWFYGLEIALCLGLVWLDPGRRLWNCFRTPRRWQSQLVFVALAATFVTVNRQAFGNAAASVQARWLLGGSARHVFATSHQGVRGMVVVLNGAGLQPGEVHQRLQVQSGERCLVLYRSRDGLSQTTRELCLLLSPLILGMAGLLWLKRKGT